jgi:hypothetical protein
MNAELLTSLVQALQITVATSLVFLGGMYGKAPLRCRGFSVIRVFVLSSGSYTVAALLGFDSDTESRSIVLSFSLGASIDRPSPTSARR